MTEKIDAKEKKKICTLVIICTLYVILQIMQGVLGRYGDYSIPFSGLTLDSFHGSITSIQMLLAVSAVCVSRPGYYVAQTLLICTVILMTYSMVVRNSFDSFPGLTMLISGIIIIQIIHSYLVKLSHKEKELYSIAHTDALTELPNRRSLKLYMADKVREDTMNNKRFAICMVDLDNFKNINDTIGHEYGDIVLSTISNRWKNLMNKNDYIARLGGDEFTILINDFESLKELDQHIKEFSKAVSEKIELKGNDYALSASIGVSLFPSDSSDTSQLLKYADTAMYAAKNQGKKRICYFDGMMNDLVENSVQLESVVRHAVENDAFKLVYQPQYQARDKKLRGFEALIRLSDAKGKQLSPAQFIPVAEKSSLIIDVDKWVLENAMRDFIPLLKKNSEIILSINISASHMLDREFIEDVDCILKKTGFPAKNLELELTESVFVDSLSKAKEIMLELKKRGIHIALDDFGTGYSSLSYLKELPIDLLKIDKAFVDSIKDGPKEESFVAAIISLSQLMQFAVISEGVEEEYQLNTLKQLGCDYIQGFLWGRPQVLEEVENLI